MLEKIIFIQDFLKLENEKAISQFEKLLQKETKANFKSMSVIDFQKRIENSIDDSKNGRVKDSDQLISEIEKWS